jgi:hypothetical protein
MYEYLIPEPEHACIPDRLNGHFIPEVEIFDEQ